MLLYHNDNQNQTRKQTMGRHINGRYEDGIILTPTLTDAEREAGKLLKQVDANKTELNTNNHILDLSQGSLDNAVQAKAEFDVEKQLIIDSTMNSVEKSTAQAVLANKNRMTESNLAQCQSVVDEDTETVRKLNAKLMVANTAYKNHMTEMSSTISPEELKQLTSIPRTKLTPEQRVTLVSALGLDGYNALPMV